MDTRVPPDDGGFLSPGRPAVDSLEQRMAAVERRLTALEGSIRDAVAQEVQGAGDELRRAVSDLGRLLLRDLDRLTKVLAEHRDAIVERLSAVSAGAVPPSADAVAEVADEAANEAANEATPPSEPAPLSGEAGWWRALPGKRRRRGSPKEPPDSDTSPE
jgi:ABC-type transporter Mla subunit MlaD